MKRLFLCAALLFGSAFAVDEYPPIAPGRLEVGLGYQFGYRTGLYNDDGERFSWDRVPGEEREDFDLDSRARSISTFALQAKVGLLPGLGLEIGAEAVYSPPTATNLDNEVERDLYGITQPRVGLKYFHAPIGLGAYVQYELPVGLGSVTEPQEVHKVEMGGVLRRDLGPLRFTALGGYAVKFEGDDGYEEGNHISVLLKPEYVFSGERFTVYVASQSQWRDGYLYPGNDGRRTTPASFWVAGPGATARLSPRLFMEAGMPVSLAGRNVFSLWSAFIEARATFF